MMSALSSNVGNLAFLAAFSLLGLALRRLAREQPDLEPGRAPEIDARCYAPPARLERVLAPRGESRVAARPLSVERRGAAPAACGAAPAESALREAGAGTGDDGALASTIDNPALAQSDFTRLRARILDERSARRNGAPAKLLRAGPQFEKQDAAGIDRAGKHELPEAGADKAQPLVKRRVADQQHQAMAAGLGGVERALRQGLADASRAKRLLDRERPEQQRRRVADGDPRECAGAHQHAADAGDGGQRQVGGDALAQAIGGLGETPWSEGALLQFLDGGQIGGRL
jgi:hypothetical protein